jgi:hypothetical protein
MNPANRPSLAYPILMMAVKTMHRRTVKLGGRLSGVAIAPSGRLESAPPVAALSDVLAFPAPPAAALSEPVPDPVEVLALRNVLAELSRVVEKLGTQEHATIEKVAQTTVELGVALAERLVNAEIAADRQRLDRVVRDALERMQPARTLTVRGHADDLALLQRQLAEHAELAGFPGEFTFRPEKVGARGQLKIEADEWFIEFDTQRSLAELRDRLLEETFTNE